MRTSFIGAGPGQVQVLAGSVARRPTIATGCRPTDPEYPALADAGIVIVKTAPKSASNFNLHAPSQETAMFRMPMRLLYYRTTGTASSQGKGLNISRHIAFGVGSPTVRRKIPMSGCEWLHGGWSLSAVAEIQTDL